MIGSSAKFLRSAPAVFEACGFFAMSYAVNRCDQDPALVAANQVVIARLALAGRTYLATPISTIGSFIVSTSHVTIVLGQVGSNLKFVHQSAHPR